MFEYFKLKKRGMDNMEKIIEMGDGVLSNKMQNLYNIAVEMADNVSTIDNDKSILARRKGLDSYTHALDNYEAQYREIAEHLERRANVKKLLNFVAEWAIYDPSILIGLAENLGLMQCWHHVPERSARRR